MKTIITPTPGRPANTRRDAFSLIEVVLAIGVMALAIIPLMALLPTGLSSYRSASDSMTQTAIMRYVSSLLASKTPTAWPTNDLYFSGELTLLTNSAPTNAAYRVTFVSSTNATLSFAHENLPTDSGTTNIVRLWRVSYVLWDTRSGRIIGTNGFELANRDSTN